MPEASHTPSESKRIYLTGGWGYGNRGDDAILAGTLQGIARVGSSAIGLTSFRARETERTNRHEAVTSVHGLLSLQRPNPGSRRIGSLLRWPGVLSWSRSGDESLLPRALRQHLDAMRKSDLVVFGGGGYFNDTWSDAFRSRLIELALAKASGTPYVMIAQTFGPFSDHTAVDELADALSGVKLVTYRDRHSKRALELAGVPRERMHYTADSAHLVTPGSRSPATDRRPRIGLVVQHFRPYGGPQGTISYGSISSRSQYIRRLLETVDLVTEQVSAEFVMIPSTTWDESIAGEVLHAIESQGRPVSWVDLHERGVSEYVSACQDVDALLSTNMHPAILASRAGVPTVALSYNFKFDDYMEAIGRSPFTHRLDDFSPISVSAQVVEALDAKRVDRDEIAGNAQALATQARQGFELLAGCFE